MIKLFFAAFVAFCFSEAYSQQNEKPDIYQICLTRYLESYKIEAKSKGSVFVERNDLTTESMSAKISNISILYLNQQDIKVETKNEKRIHLIRVNPMRIEDELIKISIINFYVSRRKNHFRYINSGGETYKFKFNCENSQFEIVK